MQEPPLPDVLRAIRRGQTTAFAGIYSWLLAKVARNLGVMPGGEFRTALREAKVVDAPVSAERVVLTDVPAAWLSELTIHKTTWICWCLQCNAADLRLNCRNALLCPLARP